MRIIQFEGVIGFPQRTLYTGCVTLVTFFHIGQYIIERGILTPGFHLIKPSLSPYFGRSSKEKLEFSIRKYDRAYIAAVHHHTFFFSQNLLLCYQCFPHESQCAHTAGAVGCIEGADLPFHVLTIEIGLLFSVTVGFESDANISNMLPQMFLIHLRIGDPSVAYSEQRYGAIHRAAVYIGVSQLPCQPFGDRALATRRETVDGYIYIFTLHSNCLLTA